MRPSPHRVYESSHCPWKFPCAPSQSLPPHHSHPHVMIDMLCLEQCLEHKSVFLNKCKVSAFGKLSLTLTFGNDCPIFSRYAVLFRIRISLSSKTTALASEPCCIWKALKSYKTGTGRVQLPWVTRKGNRFPVLLNSWERYVLTSPLSLRTYFDRFIHQVLFSFPPAH